MAEVFDRRRTMVPRKYEPRQLNSLHHAILRLSLLGHSQVEISKALNCTPATVSTVLNSGLGRQQSQLLRAEADKGAIDAARRIRELAPRAIEVVEEILNDGSISSSTRLHAAKDLLDRAGFAPVRNVKIDSTSVHLSADDLESLKMNAMSRAMQSGLVIDSDVVAVEQKEVTS